MIQENQIQTLVDLGLSFLQAKIYLNLVKLGNGDVKNIARVSKTARQDIYRIIPTLQKLGLVEKVIADTAMYKPVPIKEGLSVLLQRKKDECTLLEKKTNILREQFDCNNLLDFQEENIEFKITSELTLLLTLLRRLTEASQSSIDIILPWKLCQKILLDRNYLKKTQKDVKIRILAREVNNKQLCIPKSLSRTHLIEIKHTYEETPLGMHIFDRKEITLCISEKEALPCLFSKNIIFVKMATAFFDKIWKNAE
jgi:sugar-specific transcriptional regulator TrmB